MTRTRTLMAAVMVCVATATAPAESPEMSPVSTPPTKNSVKEMDAAPADTDKAVSPAVVEEVWYVEVIQNPMVKYAVPATAFLAVLVIALFVVRWRKTGEIPGPSTGGHGPVAGP